MRSVGKIYIKKPMIKLRMFNKNTGEEECWNKFSSKKKAKRWRDSLM